MRRSALLALAALATAASWQLLPASPSAANPAAEGSDTREVDPAAVQLSDDYDISYEEALARVDRQVRVADLAAALTTKYPTTFGSLYIDHVDGGTVVVNRVIADAGIADEVSRAGLADVVRYSQVEHSSSELSNVFQDLSKGLPAVQSAESPLALSVEPRSQRVVVGSVPGAALTAQQKRWLQQAQAKYGRAVGRGGVGRASASACSWPSCDAPLRGGLWISNTTSGSNTCTSGFMAQSKTDTARRFMITAGHCTGTTYYQKKSTQGVFVKIGNRHANSYFDSTGDAALYTIDSNTEWTPRGWVYVRPSTHSDPALSTTENASYAILRGSTAGTGAYVCHTGATIGTRCGEVLDGTFTGTYDGKTVNNLARVRFTNCQGDSGGPVYRSNTAYGIYVALESPFGAGTVVNPSGGTSSCSYYGWYHHIGPALSRLNVDLTSN